VPSCRWRLGIGLIQINCGNTHLDPQRREQHEDSILRHLRPARVWRRCDSWQRSIVPLTLFQTSPMAKTLRCYGGLPALSRSPFPTRCCLEAWLKIVTTVCSCLSYICSFALNDPKRSPCGSGPLLQPIFTESRATSLLVDPRDDVPVRKAVSVFAGDVENVLGKATKVVHTLNVQEAARNLGWHREILAGILTTAIAMKEQGALRWPPLPGHLQRVDDQTALHVWLQAPTHHAPVEQIDDYGQIQPAFLRCDVGDVARPGSVWTQRREVAIQPVRSYRKIMPTIGGGHAEAPLATRADAMLLAHAQPSLAQLAPHARPPVDAVHLRMNGANMDQQRCSAVNSTLRPEPRSCRPDAPSPSSLTSVSTIPKLRAASETRWPDSTRRTASCLNSSV